MTRKSAHPQSRHHVWLYDSDWEVLCEMANLAHMTPSEYLRTLIHNWASEVTAKLQEIDDE